MDQFIMFKFSGPFGSSCNRYDIETNIIMDHIINAIHITVNKNREYRQL